MGDTSYLKNPTSSILKGQDKIIIHSKVKNLNYYSKKCGYIVAQSNYATLNDIIKDANIIRHYGNEPCVRRSIKLLNMDNKIKTSFYCIMSAKTRQTLQLKEQIKKQTTPSFKVKKGFIIIVFE